MAYQDGPQFQLGATYRALKQQADRLPKTKWTPLVMAGLLVILDHWFIWPILIGVGGRRSGVARALGRPARRPILRPKPQRLPGRVGELPTR
jgi:hypothetical protein